MYKSQFFYIYLVNMDKLLTNCRSFTEVIGSLSPLVFLRQFSARRTCIAYRPTRSAVGITVAIPFVCPTECAKMAQFLAQFSRDIFTPAWGGVTETNCKKISRRYSQVLLVGRTRPVLPLSYLLTYLLTYSVRVVANYSSMPRHLTSDELRLQF